MSNPESFDLRGVGFERPPRLEPEAHEPVRLVTAAAATEQAMELATREAGVRFCVTAIDNNLFELGAKDFCLIVGYAHSGKTMFLLSALAQQLERRWLWITPDEVPHMVHRRLVGMISGLGPHQVQAGYAGQDEEAWEAISWVNSQLDNLLMFDEVRSFSQLDQVVQAACDHWQAPPDVLVFDYLTCLPHKAEHIAGLAMQFKLWAKPKPFPSIVIHQASRTAGARGQRMQLWSGAYGGEQEAIVLIGITRPSDDPESFGSIDRNVLTVELLKNKHSGRKARADMYQNPVTGLIYEPMSPSTYEQGRMWNE